ATPNVGDEITYTITLSDAGPDAATHVRVSDVLPSGLHFVSANPSHGGYDPSSGFWTVDTVSSRTSEALSITATVVSSDPQPNTASISNADQFDPDTGNHIASVLQTPRALLS